MSLLWLGLVPEFAYGYDQTIDSGILYSLDRKQNPTSISVQMNNEREKTSVLRKFLNDFKFFSQIFCTRYKKNPFKNIVQTFTMTIFVYMIIGWL